MGTPFSCHYLFYLMFVNFELYTIGIKEKLFEDVSPRQGAKKTMLLQLAPLPLSLQLVFPYVSQKFYTS